MDPVNNLQDVIRCFNCEELPVLYCQFCHIRFCKNCTADHLLDETKEHKVVSIQKKRWFPEIPMCTEHFETACELHCEECDDFICIKCISSEQHKNHKTVELLRKFQNKKETLRMALKELEESILPKYQKAAFEIPEKKTDLSNNSQKLKLDLKNQQEAWYDDIDKIVASLQSEIDDIDRTNSAFLEKEEAKIKVDIAKISQEIEDLKKIIDSNDARLVSKYKCTISEFRKLPVQLVVSIPNFSPESIKSEQLGTLSKPGIKTLERFYTTNAFHINRKMMDEPKNVIDIDTEYKELYHVSCLSDEEVWTSGASKVMRLYDLKGHLSQSITTISGHAPECITVMKSGNLLYTDYNDKSVNIVKNDQIQSVVTVKGWIPLGICTIYFGDFMVIFDSEDGKNTKIARYSDSKEIQSFQWEDKHPFFSSLNVKHLSENRNSDICVADWRASAVVVMNVDGEIRFKYTGTTDKFFQPRGIATDSQARILTVDGQGNRIHIINEDGTFLRFITIDNLNLPRGLCVDSKDNLFVAEIMGKLRKIQYYK